MRRLLPKRPQSQTNGLDPAPDAARRKRHQVSIACDTCRKRKIKCDSRRPACTPCLQSKSKCHFAPLETKAQRESVALRLKSDTHLWNILDLLHRSSAEESDELLRRIREASSVHDFIETFASASMLVSQVPQRGTLGDFYQQRPTHFFHLKLNSLSPSTDPLHIPDEVVARFPQGILPISQWTNVSQDDKYMTHMLNLFFSWDNTLSHIIHRTLLTDELRGATPDGHKFCSEFLLHTILAVAHLYACQGSPSRLCDELRAQGRTFANAALDMLEGELHHQSITLVQGLALLWIYEFNYGDKPRATALLEEFYNVHQALGLNSWTIPDKIGAQYMGCWQAASFVIWGLFTLDAKIAITFTRPMRISQPKIAKTFDDAHQCMLSDPKCPEFLWHPYPISDKSQVSNYRELISAECELAELIAEASPFFLSSEPETSNFDYYGLMAIYNKILAWSMGSFQRLLPNRNILPSMVVLEVTYELLLIKILDSLCYFPAYPIHGETASSTRTSHAVSIISNLWVYRVTHGLRHEYWLMQACFVSAVSIITKAESNASLSKSIGMACQLLYSMGDYLPAADECLWLIKQTFLRGDIKIPKACRMIFARVAVRSGKILIRDVLVLPLDADQDEANDRREGSSLQEVAFSNLIETIRDLDAGDSDYSGSCNDGNRQK